MANYLVLGGSGFIGKSLVKAIQEESNTVDNLDFRDNKDYDLRFLKLNNLEKYDGCFFLAWDVGGSKYISSRNDWNSQFVNNLQLITNLLPQLNDSSTPYLFVSSQLAGINTTPYSLTKLAGEKYCLISKNSMIVRQWNVYGNLEDLNLRSHVISDFIVQALTTGVIKLMTTGTEKRKFVHVDDVCNAYINLMKNRLFGIFDVSGDEYVPILQIANLIVGKTTAKVEIGKIVIEDSNVGSFPVVPNRTQHIDSD